MLSKYSPNNSYFAGLLLNQGFIKVSEGADHFATIILYQKSVEGFR